MAEVVGSLSPITETWIELLAPGCSPRHSPASAIVGIWQVTSGWDGSCQFVSQIKEKKEIKSHCNIC